VQADAASDDREVKTMPAQSKEAPGELALVRAFVNTLDVETATEELADPQALSAWLLARGLVEKGTAARPADVRRAVALREALRELLLSNNDGRPVPPEAARVLEETSARARPRLRVDSRGAARLEAAGTGVDAALGRLVIIVYQAMETGAWPRLKACRSDTCKWAFYVHSKNRSGHWCSMAACGSQHKARSYRERKRSS
jgi:predicted RNA-binding Zn ribbon-like protein